jgi:4-hydroxy-3-methylbut-2-enyl diphosphate reductase
MNSDNQKRLLVARPRGFCAGVERAIEVVDRLIEARGTPLYVRREIVHNRAVVEDFRRRGVVFVEELDQVPDGSTVVFSAHGVAPAVRQDALERGLEVIDATCPLVTRVHREVQRHDARKRSIVLVGHAGHDEVLGTMGEAPGAITLVTGVEDVERLELPADTPVAVVTQTTLSVDETEDIMSALHARFPGLIEPSRGDICYATQNRQDAVKALVEAGIGHLLVVGSANSSNSRRLCEVARTMGTPASLVDGPDELPLDELRPHRLLGLTAGASAPEHLVRAVAGRLSAEGWRTDEQEGLEENVRFQLPKELLEIEGQT